MKKEAFFSDGTMSYIRPAEPAPNEPVTIVFRMAAGETAKVYLLTQTEELPMQYTRSEGAFDYYTAASRLGQGMFSYQFLIKGEGETVYYNRYGTAEQFQDDFSFQIMPGYTTPYWAKGAVMYQIFLDRFCNGDPANDVVDGEYIYIGERVGQVKDWYRNPKAMDVREFYGGDLQGVLDKLDYLQDLGVEVIYFNPIFVSPSNHKYDTQDYDYVDPHCGVIVHDGGSPLPDNAATNEQASKYQIRTTDRENLEASNRLLIKVIEEAHSRGMKVILDGVFNHCGSFNKWMDREGIYKDAEGYEPGAYEDFKSPYHRYFNFYAKGIENWPRNDNYEGWWGHNTLPKLNYEESDALEAYILDLGRKWVSAPYNADGWRLDVAADLGKSNDYNHYFWKKFRKAVKSANPEAIILAEHYGDPSDWLAGDEWDSIMNYDAFMEPITYFLTGMEKHSDEYRPDLFCNSDYFVHTIKYHMTRMLYPSLMISMNQLSNHDHSRFLTRTNHKVGRVATHGSEAAAQGINKAVMREAVVMQMTWIGAPTLYYGDEAGLCGFTDPDNRRTYPWGREDCEMIAFHKEMIWIHKNYRALKLGSIQLLSWNGEVLSYGRFLSNEQIITVVNNGDKLREVSIPVWITGAPLHGKMNRIIYTYEDGYTNAYEEYDIVDGEVILMMGSHSALVLKTKR